MAGTIVIDTVKSSLSTPPVFQNTSGVEIGQLCRAWVNFNGVTTASIRASFNVSSVTRNGTGDYTINFTNAFSDANYSVVGMGSQTPASYSAIPFMNNNVAPTTTTLRVLTAGFGALDSAYVNLAIFR